MTQAVWPFYPTRPMQGSKAAVAGSKRTTSNNKQAALIKQAGGAGPNPWVERPKVRRLSFGNRPRQDQDDPIERLLPQHAQYLIDRAIIDDVARERKYVSAGTRAQLRDLGFPERQQLAPALVVPLNSAQGQRSTYQIRPDQPRSVDGRIAKFELAAGSSAVIDVPARMNRMPTPRIKDASEPLIFTEGAPKADAAAGIDLCCAALVGVWGVIVGTPEGSTAISTDLREFALKGRTVYLGFDSDQMRKRQVYYALKVLREILESYGAKVSIIYLPDRPDGTKRG